MKVIFSMIVLLMSFTLSGCTNQPGAAPNSKSSTRVARSVHGEWTGEREYQNQVFDFKVTVPQDWHFEKRLSPAATEIGTDLLAGDDKNLRGSLESAMKNTFTPFMAYRYPPGTPGKSNPNIICMIENIGHLPGIKSAADYLLVMEDSLNNTQVNVSFQNEPESVRLGGVKFAMRKSTLKIGLLNVRQRSYARKEGDNILMIAVTILEEGDEEVIQELMKTIGPVSSN